MHKVLLIGAGSICPTHIAAFNALQPRAKVVGVCDMKVDMAQMQIDRAGIDAVAYPDYKKAIEESGCDIVSVMVPPAVHKEIAVYAMEHGCNVLVEKPMAPSLEECDAMIETAARTGKKLGVVAQSRFLTPIYRTKKLLDSGMAGKLLYTQINSNWFRGKSYYDLAWRGKWSTEGGGCTYIHAVHHIDLLAWMAGMPSEVVSMIGNVSHTNSEEEDISMAMLRYDNGSFGQLCANLISHGQEQGLTFTCEKASLKIPHAMCADVPLENGFPKENSELLGDLESAYEAIPALEFEGHAGIANDLVCAIDEDRNPLIDGQAGRNTMELIMAVYKSASEGKPVKLPIGRDDPFYTRAGVQANMPKFYEKTGFLSHYEKDEIVLASTNMK